jgi:hypothetical protein
MAKTTAPPEPISELIDRIEALREELLSIQRSLEKIEPDAGDALHTNGSENWDL